MHPVVRKLSIFTGLSPQEAFAVGTMTRNVVEVRAGTEIVRENDLPITLFFLLEGVVVRHKGLPSGDRQILSFLLPGDACDVGATLLEVCDHSLTSLTTCRLAMVEDSAIAAATSEYPRLAVALTWARLVEESIAREWLLNVGRRDALSAISHLFCEQYYHLRAIGLADQPHFSLPLTQTDIATRSVSVRST